MSQPSLDEIPSKTSDPSPQAAAEAADTPRSRLADIAVTIAILLASFAVGLVGGYGAKLLNFPLPWMTGSLLITAALGLSGLPVRSLWQARAAGQFVTGAAVGTTFTPAILLTILTLLPAMMLGALISVAIAVFGALILMRLVDLDPKTALLATMPGGVIEMANVAKRVNADPLPITVLQTMRVGLTVGAAPFLVTWLAEAGARNVVAQGEVMSWLAVLALMGASLVGGLALNRFTLPNAWFLGSLLVMAALGAMGLIPGRVPEPILVIAQVIHRGVDRNAIQARVPHPAVAPAAGVAGDSAVCAGDARLARRALFACPGLAGDDAGAGAGAGRDRGNGADRQGARPRRGADHRLPDRAHHHGAGCGGLGEPPV